MLRIAPGPQGPMSSPPMPMPPSPPMPGDAATPDAPPGDQDSSKTPQHLVVYRGPDEGPFACGNCVHFDGQSSCEVVQGKVDPAGLCNIFMAGSGQPDPDAPAAPPDVTPPPGLPS